MEQDTLSPTPDTPEEATPESGPVPYATWVHVGPGAENCADVHEDRGVSECQNPLHFHAWCTLPNPFVESRLQEKALAARARKARAMRDPDTDAYQVLEGELDLIAAEGDKAKPPLVEELVQRDFWRDFYEAKAAVDGIDDEESTEDEPVKKYAHIDEDRRRLRDLEAMEPDERPRDEYDTVGKHVDEYDELLTKEREKLQEARRQPLLQRDISDLIDEVRKARIDSAGMTEFMVVHAFHTILEGTFTGPGGDKRFAGPIELERSSGEVYGTLQDTFRDLERTKNRSPEGNW